MQDGVLLKKANAVQDGVLLIDDVLLVNAVKVALSALVWVSVRQRLGELPELVAARTGKYCQRELQSPASTTNDLDLEPKGDYEQYGYNNRIYYHEVVRVGGKEDQGSGGCPGRARGWTWRTGPSGTAPVRRIFVRAQR